MFVFSFKTNYLPIKTIAAGAMVCPLCARTTAINLHLFQVEQEGVVVQRLNKMVATATCGGCGHSIEQKQFPGPLRDLFERERSNTTLQKSLKLGSMGKRALLVASACFALAGGIFLADHFHLLDAKTANVEFDQQIQSAYRASPAVGDLYKVVVSLNQQYTYRWFRVSKIDNVAKTVTLQASKEAGTPMLKNLANASTAVAGFDPGQVLQVHKDPIQMMRLESVDANADGANYQLFSVTRPAQK
jgi:hypothetical protein